MSRRDLSTEPRLPPHRCRRLCLAFGVLGFAASARFASGQERVRSGVELAAHVRVLRPGTVLRVWVGARRTEEPLVTATPDSLRLGTGVVALSAVDSLWVKQRATARGAIIGGLVGGLAFALGLRALVLGICDSVDRCKDDEWPALGIGFAIGGAGGGLTGAVIGAFVPVWKRLSP